MENLKELDVPHEIMQLGDSHMRCGEETVLGFYLRLITEGQSPKMAEALAVQQSPGIGITDTIYIADQNRHGTTILDRMGGDEAAVERLSKGLARRGYKLKPHDHYIPTAARFANDPAAIVNHKQTLADLKRNVKDRGVAARGIVDADGDNSRAPAKKKYRLNPQIVERIDSRQISENPDLRKISKPDRCAEIVEKHGASKDKD
jgi:hypothetical protein